MFGRVETYKGFDQFLDDVLLSSPNPNLKVFLVGECKDEALRRRIVDGIEQINARGGFARFVEGRVSDSVLIQWIRASNVCLFPFRQITNSGSLLLAASQGTVCLATPHSSLEGLPEELVKFASEPEYFQQALALSGSAKKVRAATDFFKAQSWRVVANEHLVEYRNLLIRN